MKSKKSTRVLIVDDDEDDYYITSDYIRRIPGSKFIIDWCPKYNDAVALLESRKYDIYLVDYLLGGHTGVDFLKEASKRNCKEPIILLTGRGNLKVDMEAMELGAVDYLIKSELNTEGLERSIRYAIERSNNINALKANERKYRAIFEQSRDLLFIADEQLKIIDINDAVEDILHYSKEEIANILFLDLIKQADHKIVIEENLRKGKDILDLEVLMETKSGDLKNCILSIVIENRNLSEELRYHGIIHDITNLKKVEKATLQNEKLATVGRLIRTLAHEVRNPLNNITLSTEQLKQELVDENSELYIDIIQRNSKRIGDIITELLNASRSSEIKLEKHILQNILDEVIATAIDRLTLKHMKLAINFPNDKLYIVADKTQLTIAFLNIVINAIEAMEERKGILSISLLSEKDFTILQIADNGCGISDENISKLFEPYFTQKRNGMGLGLASTLNILQAHNATIDVKSVVGSGTVFTIALPKST